MSHVDRLGKLEYNRIHKWIARHYIKTGRCQICTQLTYTEMSNKTGKYLRDLRDWQEVCRRCHYKYDVEILGMTTMADRGKNANHRGQKGGFATMSKEDLRVLSVRAARKRWGYDK